MVKCITNTELALDRKWWTLALRGFIAVIFGLMLMNGYQNLAIIFGVFALVTSFTTIMSGLNAYGEGKHSMWLLLEGVIGLGAGVAAFSLPMLGFLSLITLIGSWAIIIGALEIMTAVKFGKEGQSMLALVISGAVSLIFGLVLMGKPIAFGFTNSLIIGVYAVFMGLITIILALMLRNSAACKLQKA